MKIGFCSIIFGYLKTRIMDINTGHRNKFHNVTETEMGIYTS